MGVEDYIQLLDELKILVKKQVVIPAIGKNTSTMALSKLDNTKEYIINIRRGNYNAGKCTFHAMTADKKVGLLRLDVGDNNLRHKNPDGKTITGTHLHVYKEGYELAEAIEFDVKNDNLVQLCLEFLQRFNIIDIKAENISLFEQQRLFS